MFLFLCHFYAATISIAIQMGNSSCSQEIVPATEGLESCGLYLMELATTTIGISKMYLDSAPAMESPL